MDEVKRYWLLYTTDLIAADNKTIGHHLLAPVLLILDCWLRVINCEGDVTAVPRIAN
jgi:hypothetical protein